MAPKRLLLALFVGLASCTTGWGKSSVPSEPTGPLKPKVTTACPPPEFDLAQLAHGALGIEPQPKVKELRILAWEESALDPDIYEDEALIWVETESDGFVIAHVTTHHGEPDWGPVGSDSGTFSGTVTTPAAPTHDQFERFLNQSKWTWSGTRGFTRVASSVCADAWTKSFGQPPWHKFAPAAAGGNE